MSNRPEALESHLAEKKSRNDAIIMNGLGLLEDPQNWKEYKITAKGLQEIIKSRYDHVVSVGAINSRDWALKKIRTLKEAKKNNVEKNDIVKSKVAVKKEQVEQLRERVNNLLKQNAQFYEEILALKDMMGRKNSELDILSKTLKQCQASKVVRFK